MERLTANPTPHPLDAAARAELARKVDVTRLEGLAKDAIVARREKERCVNELRFDEAAMYRGIEVGAERSLREYCTPDVILALLASVRGAEADTEKVTRFEVIDHRENPGYYRRTFVARPCRVELSYQDDGRTLKVFVDDAASAHPPTEEPAA